MSEKQNLPSVRRASQIGTDAPADEAVERASAIWKKIPRHARARPGALPRRAEGQRAGNGLVAVVGVGASAGGLEAFRRLLARLPDNTGMAFVLVAHLAPRHKTILPEFGDPRASIALGRGAVGSARLRSEAYTAARLAAQLDEATAEFATNQPGITVDAVANLVSVNPILSWHEKEFVAAYSKPGPDATGRDSGRSPIERAILALIAPHLLPLEREFIERNTFRVAFHPFNWRLNDLTGGRSD